MKIFCIGRNYAEHAKEMNSAVPDEPLIFMKPPTALVQEGKPIYYPDFTKSLHYECELVLKIGKNGKSISEQYAMDYVSELTLGIDFTARDLQAELKKKGHPWEIAKAFDNSAPVGKFLPANEVNNWNDLTFDLTVNGETKQTGHTEHLIFSIPYLIKYISHRFTLQKGDLIFTGTPEGVGEVHVGDKLVASFEGEEVLNFEVK